MKKMLSALVMWGTLAGAAHAADLGVAPPPPPPPAFPAFGGYAFPPVIVQLGPTTAYSTINCANFTKLPDGSWKALNPTEFGLGYVENIVPPVIPIKSGGFIYNNIDLYAQLESQCAVALVRARY